MTDAMDLVASYTSSPAYLTKQAQLAASTRAPTNAGTGGTGFDDEIMNGFNAGKTPEEVSRVVFETYNDLGYKVDYQQLLVRAKELKSGMPVSTPGATPSTTPSSTTNVNSPLQNEIQKLQLFNTQRGFGKNQNIKETLMNKGFTTQEIDRALHPVLGTMSDIGNKITNLFGR
jgi:hypothetical protein